MLIADCRARKWMVVAAVAIATKQNAVAESLERQQKTTERNEEKKGKH